MGVRNALARKPRTPPELRAILHTSLAEKEDDWWANLDGLGHLGGGQSLVWDWAEPANLFHLPIDASG